MNIISLLKKYSHEDGEYLLAHVLHKSREFVIAHPEYNVDFLNTWKYKKCIRLRERNIPLAYITGHKEFFGFDFLVNKYTLIPRPETELLVEEVVRTFVEKIKKNETKFYFFDVGTGSGCIPISVLKTLENKKNINSTVETTAIDVSGQALTVAQKNAAIHKTDIHFCCGNLLEPIQNNPLVKDPSIILTANLPYLTQKQFDEETSIQHEPYTALVADDNGLALYKKLLHQVQELQQTIWTKNSCTLFFEIDPSQTTELCKFIHDLFPAAMVETIPDLRQQDRVIKICI